MSSVAVATLRPRTPEITAAIKPRSQTASFQELMDSVSGAAAPPKPVDPSALRPPVTTVVREGDCLSRLCLNQLLEMKGAVSSRETYSAVLKVAKANHIADPDMIHPGQKLDLSVLADGGSGQAASSGQAKPWKAVVEGAVAISSPFGLRMDPFTGQLKQHDGIDLAAPAGSAVSALEAGHVVFSGWKPGCGNTVIVQHEDGLETLYGHLSKALVQVGDQVAAHAPIACVGSTGHSTGPHLHFEIRRNGQALDPCKAWPVPESRTFLALIGP